VVALFLSRYCGGINPVSVGWVNEPRIFAVHSRGAKKIEGATKPLID
jgi:hypothetical protein